MIVANPAWKHLSTPLLPPSDGNNGNKNLIHVKLSRDEQVCRPIQGMCYNDTKVNAKYPTSCDLVERCFADQKSRDLFVNINYSVMHFLPYIHCDILQL